MGHGSMARMTRTQERDAALADLIERSDGVLDTRTVLERLSYSELRWRLRTRRWQQPCKGTVVTHSGRLSGVQALRVALSWAGPGSALGGLTAARMEGFSGFGDKLPYETGPIYVIVGQGWKRRTPVAGLHIVTHYSRIMGELDIHPLRDPRRTRISRSIVDAAVWAPNERLTMAILAAGVGQRLARPADLAAAIRRQPSIKDRGAMLAAVADIGGGAQALSELDFIRMVVRAHRLPAPDAQVPRRDSRGRRRYIDVVWEKWKVVAEIDGKQHEEPLQRWDDYQRDIDLQIDGYRILRFPAWAVRTHPDLIAAQLRRVLGEACP
jgi:very-short-patch-repair endonuclease